VVLGGCGFESRAGLAGDPPSDGAAPGGDAPGSDAGAGSDAGSGAGSDGGTASCLQRWITGGPGLVLAQPQPLALTTTTDDRDPWISADGFRLYFVRTPGTHMNSNDIYLATRTSLTQDFGNAGPVDNLDTNGDESRAALNGDETLVVYAGNNATVGGNFQIFASTRNDRTKPFPSPSATDRALVAAVNTVNNYFDPFLTTDGLRLYVAPVLTGQQQIMLATRVAGQNFGPAAVLPVVNSSTSGGDADPALSLDERIVVFTSLRTASGLGGTNLWYATRPSATGDFSPPQLIPGVNSSVQDGDPMLSADGCELYFASNRAGDGKNHLFRAVMAPQR
jgi:Tol biopolymer transport system component